MSTQYLNQDQLKNATEFIASDPELTPAELVHYLAIDMSPERMQQVLRAAYLCWFNPESGRWHIGNTAIETPPGEV